jgi:hypothetical protein
MLKRGRAKPSRRGSAVKPAAGLADHGKFLAMQTRLLPEVGSALFTISSHSFSLVILPLIFSSVR